MGINEVEEDKQNESKKWHFHNKNWATIGSTRTKENKAGALFDMEGKK